MSNFSKALARYIDTMANPQSGISDEMQAAEALCASIESKAQAQIAHDSLDDASRIMGSHVADNATDSAYHLEESEGCAYLVLNDDSAIWAEWDSYGFWYVTITTKEKAYREMEGKALEYEISEEYDLEESEE